ncbi:acyltransferase [Flagellimonas sp. CMM7]|nr:acyltransferase [Flagellimonas sp. CMM7]
MSVVLYHLTHTSNLLDTNGLVYNLFKYGGGFGVCVFFVISGFILPYSMLRGGYSIKNFKSFFIKRIIRIEPVYVASIFLTIYVFYTASELPSEYWKFGDYRVDFTNFLLHFGYLVSFFKNQEWINPVFWSLGVEFQFYLIIGLIFPLLVYKRKLINFLWMSIFILLSWLLFVYFIKGTYLHYGGTALRVMPIFFIGIAIFQFKEKLIDKYSFAILLVVLFYICTTDYKWGDIAGVFFAVISIFLVRNPPKLFLFFGKISFSLYLIHVPLGGIMKLFIREHFESDFVRTLFTFLSILPIIAISYGFYKLIEEPSVIWSKKFRYSGNKDN